MTEKKITEKAKLSALENGADMVGVLNVKNLPEHSERIERMLPGAKSVQVIASRHSLASLRSAGLPSGGTRSRRRWRRRRGSHSAQ